MRGHFTLYKRRYTTVKELCDLHNFKDKVDVIIFLTVCLVVGNIRNKYFTINIIMFIMAGLGHLEGA